MNIKHYLLSRIAEEAVEVAKAALKAQQFGMKSINPATGQTNEQELRQELVDLQAVTHMLADFTDAQEYSGNLTEIAEKTDKVARYSLAAATLGGVKLGIAEEQWLKRHLFSPKPATSPRPEKTKSLKDIPVGQGGMQRTDQ